MWSRELREGNKNTYCDQNFEAVLVVIYLVVLVKGEVIRIGRCRAW